MINFSLIIPVYNKEKVLQTTLDSIVENHDIPDEEFECILVNESSTDNSENICKVYSEKYKYIKYKITKYFKEKNIKKKFEFK